MKSTKRGRIIIGSLLTILVLILASNIWLVSKMKPDIHYVYNIEENFEGCIFTIYDQENEEELRLEDDKIVINLNSNGYFKTSSSFFYGLKDKEDSFFRKDYIKKKSKEQIDPNELEEVGVFEETHNGKKFFYTSTKYKTKDACVLDLKKL